MHRLYPGGNKPDGTFKNGKGVRDSLTKKEMKSYESRIQRSKSLPKWDVLIDPLTGYFIFREIPNEQGRNNFPK